MVVLDDLKRSMAVRCELYFKCLRPLRTELAVAGEKGHQTRLEELLAKKVRLNHRSIQERHGSLAAERFTCSRAA